MRYKPDLSKFNYPNMPDEHMIEVKHIVDTNFDENYNYYNNSFWYHFIRFLANIIIIFVMYPFMYFAYGLKIEGRKKRSRSEKIKN